MIGASEAAGRVVAERFESRRATLGRRLATVPTTLLAAPLLLPRGARVDPARLAVRSPGRRAADGAPLRGILLAHLLPPRPGGPLAALAAAPGVECVFLAHVGFEKITTLRDLWSGALRDRAIRGHCWRVAARDIPKGRAERLAWLDAQWRRMDAWIETAHRAEVESRGG